MPGWFRLDRTEGQKHALYVAAEKDTLRRQLTGWLAHTGIMVVCGFGSQSYVCRPRPSRRRPEGSGAPGGDFDCSGEDVERDGQRAPPAGATRGVSCSPTTRSSTMQASSLLFPSSYLAREA